jgi:hypothetical protein
MEGKGRGKGRGRGRGKGLGTPRICMLPMPMNFIQFFQAEIVPSRHLSYFLYFELLDVPGYLSIMTSSAVTYD